MRLQQYCQVKSFSVTYIREPVAETP